MKYSSKRTFRLYWQQITLYKGWMLLLLFCLLVGVVGGMSFSLVVRELFVTLDSGLDKAVVVPKLLDYLWLILFVEILQMVGWRGTSLILSYFQPRQLANLANDCFDYLHLHSHAFFHNNFSGALVKKVNRFVRSFEDILDRFVFDLIPLAFKLTIITSVLFYLNWILGVILMVWAVLFLLISWGFSLYKLRYDFAKAKADTRVTATLADTITNSDNVKLFAAHGYEGRRFRGDTENLAKKMTTSNYFSTLFDGVQTVLMVVLELVVLYTAIRLWEQDLLILPDFFLIQAYMLEAFMQLWNFGRTIRDMYQRFADAEEMVEILSTKHDVSDRKGAQELVVTRGDVVFENVTFSYAQSNDPVMEGLSLEVRAGQKIALIGPSGGGKSTFVKLLLRLYNLDGGRILIDGQDIGQVTQESLRESVTLVPQDPILFHRTLMDNIRYGRRDASDEEVFAAAKLAYCHDFIMKFEKGYHTFVGERGVKLSGGQRQRVAIARAILSNSKILVLDEATSSLDSESEVLIQQALENVMKQKTTFVVAHRLSTIMKADRIFVLEEGRIIEEGTHADLVNKKGSLYGKLWDIQVGGYLG